MTKLKVLLISCLITLLLTSKLTRQQDNDVPSTNCVFIGCSCGDDADQLIVSSQEYDNENGLGSATDGVPAVSLSYDITCKDEDNPSFKFKIFPERDMSKRYSHQITTLELAQNDLKYIPEDRFDKLEISMADFSRNLITGLSENAFRGIIKLELLDLSLNRLESLNVETFKPIKSTLIQLKLNNNKLSQMDSKSLSDVFSSLVSLKSLSLRHNQLDELPDLSHVAKLEELSLSHNQIEKLNDLKNNNQLLPSTLIDLSLENNRIKEINDDTFSNLRNLKYLNLESNQISVISDQAFAQLTRLTQLNLGKNYLKQIPTRIFFTLANLERVDLSAQSQIIRQIDNYAFERQSNLKPIKKIDLSNNRILTIENKAFCSANISYPYSNIKEIDLARNPIESLNPCILRQLAKGFNELTSGALNQNSKPKISFKPSHFGEKITPSLKCNCDIAKSTFYVDLEGECQNSADVSVQLKQYKCVEFYDYNQIEESCASQTQYDCREPKTTVSQTISPKMDVVNESNNNNNNKLPIINNEMNSNNRPNNKQPNQEQTSQRDKQSQIATKIPSSVESNANKILSSSLLLVNLSFILISKLF